MVIERESAEADTLEYLLCEEVCTEKGYGKAFKGRIEMEMWV